MIGADDDLESDNEDQATDSEDSADDSDLDDGEEGDNQPSKSRSTCKGAATQAKALEADVISLVHNIVCEFHKSGQCRDAFMELIEVGNKKGWFLIDGQTTEIQTRWDTLFLMIRRMLELQQVSSNHPIFKLT